MSLSRKTFRNHTLNKSSTALECSTSVKFHREEKTHLILLPFLHLCIAEALSTVSCVPEHLGKVLFSTLRATKKWTYNCWGWPTSQFVWTGGASWDVRFLVLSNGHLAPNTGSIYVVCLSSKVLEINSLYNYRLSWTGFANGVWPLSSVNKVGRRLFWCLLFLRLLRNFPWKYTFVGNWSCPGTDH